MAFTQTDLDNINVAIATGEKSVEVNGRKVLYRDMSELEAAANRIKAELAEASAASTGQRRTAYRMTFANHRGE